MNMLHMLLERKTIRINPTLWQEKLKNIMKTSALLLLGISMNACSTSWKEEVLLHDGSKIIVERSQSRGGRHEIGQGEPIKEHIVKFTPPGTHQTITWKSDEEEFLGLGLNLVLLDFKGGEAYIATNPGGCLAYNKWGRPNPPYVFFKYVDQQWKRISLAEFPTEFVQPNVVISLYEEDRIKAEEKESGFVSVASVKKLNRSLKQKEYKSILRTPLMENDLCPDWSSPRYTSPKSPD